MGLDIYLKGIKESDHFPEGDYSKEKLEEYIKMREEAEKRDHRKLGKELGLFMISEEVGKGLPLWLPNGAFIRHQLEDYMYKKELAAGYKYVYTPVLTHKNLYETSGHSPRTHSAANCTQNDVTRVRSCPTYKSQKPREELQTAMLLEPF